MKKENPKLKKLLAMVWNEAEELSHSLHTLSNTEIIECKNSLIERAEKIMSSLDEHVSDEDIANLS
jgi:flagellin-specific chaperone FliS